MSSKAPQAQQKTNDAGAAPVEGAPGVDAIRPAAGRRTVWPRRLLLGLVLLSFAVFPPAIAWFLAEPPCERHIHVESFRYGKEPSVIRCNRGDTLHLTFSTRDTAHSFFLEEFDLDAKVTPGESDVDVFRTSDPSERLGPPRSEVVIRAEHPGWLGFLVSKSQYRCHVWCGPMHAFEHGNLVIAPNMLFHAGLGLLAGIPFVGLLALRSRRGGHPPGPTTELDLMRRFPWLRSLVRRRGFQFVFMGLTMVGLYVVVLTTLLGTKVSGRNLGVMLMWVVWLFLLTAILTPLGGRIWCLVCPLPAVGDILQRGTVTGVRAGSTAGTRNRFFGLNLTWPKFLSSAWPRTLAFLTLGTFSTVLVAHPRSTGLVLVGITVLAAVMAVVWKLRTFCTYLCPVNAFLSLYSTSGLLGIGAVDEKTCTTCKPRTCKTGSLNGWACPYGLCIESRADREGGECGLCTECIKTCPYDNSTFVLRPFGRVHMPGSLGEAWLAMVMLVLATAYCVVHLGHWPEARDWVNILDKGNWSQFAAWSGALWAVALAGFPAVMLLVAKIGKTLAGSRRSAIRILQASAGALIPFGLMAWIAFVVPMLFVHVTFVEQSLSDPFGWGWNLIGAAGTPWRQLLPRGIPWIQVGCVLLGLAYGLRNSWRIWCRIASSEGAALRGAIPISALLLGIAGWYVHFFAN